MIREIIERGWNRGELDVIDRRIANSYVRHTAQGDLTGPAAFRDRVATMRSAVQDFHATIHDLAGPPDRAYCRYTVSGRHTGELLGFAPTGATIELDGAVVAHARDGQLVEEWEYLDTAVVIAQLTQSQRS